jgi:hypothetical protein
MPFLLLVCLISYKESQLETITTTCVGNLAV